MKNELIIDGLSLSFEKIEKFLVENQSVRLSKEAKKNVLKGRKLIDKWVDNGEIIYGVTTGFGEFSNVIISKNDIEKLQRNLIVSHAVGVGENLPPYIVKIMMLLRLNALARGYSGIRLETLNLLTDMINYNIIPVIPSQGSVGSSGDLAPLSHLVLAMIGKGKVHICKNVVWTDCTMIKQVNSKTALAKSGLKPVNLKAKEGLALINGTQMMTALAAFICIHAKKLTKLFDASASVTHEALRATDKAYDKRLHQLRPYDGQIQTAANMLKMIAGSEIRKSHLKNDPRVQDSYSIRCIPQVHGASRDAVKYVCDKVEIELNSVTDNPLIFPDDGDHIEGGNFHGQPLALAMDFMAVALSEYANISERRIERLVNGSLSQLPRFLTEHGGLNSGLMILQYTAASLVSENKVLAHPASVDSIPTSANQEDHNSMGSVAARKCFQILKNVQKVLAVELITASQALEFLKPLKPGKGTGILQNEIRKHVKPLKHDRVLLHDLEKVISLVENGSLLTALESKIKLY